MEIKWVTWEQYIDPIKLQLVTHAYPMRPHLFGLSLCFYTLQLAFCAQLGLSSRLLQIGLFDSMAYNAYAGLQIYQLLNWQRNDQIITGINTDKAFTFTVAHNQFSLMSLPEVQASYLTIDMGRTPIVVPPVTAAAPSIKLPTVTAIFPSSTAISTQKVISVDWRTKKAVSPIKNQGACGACWAFAAVAQLESYYAINSALNLSLSQQQLIDCSNAYGNIGCAGGMMDNAFRYVIDYGITLGSSYPYQQKTGSSCQYSRRMSLYSIKSSKIIYGDCSALVQTLGVRPVTVVVSVDINFLFYRTGVLNACGSSINHAIQLVGYYKDSSSAYYIGKNSWGTTWGQQGFIYIDANLQNGNLCSVCAYPQYPL